MKKIFLCLLIIASIQLHAQTFNEWFKQKETRIKYMLQQIVANKVYIETLQKGYHIAQSGLQTINDIRHEDFNLHSGFFDALATVNPKIKNLAKVADIIAFQIQIIKESKKAIQNALSSGQLTASELGYLQSVLNRLLTTCSKNIIVLATVITSGEFEMSDDERIAAIDKVYYETQDQLLFCKSFSGDAAMLAIQRLNEQTDVNVIRKLNGTQ